MRVAENDPLAQLSLPPGFRFYPTDEELMVQYLCKKIAGHHLSLQIIGEIDLYKFDPWVLPDKAMFGEKEWYFFSPRDRKYPNGSRPNRVAGSGYWKATGTDKVITTEGRKIGIKKALVFYVGKAPKGTKTNWIMHEYRLVEPSRRNGSPKLDDWVLCRIYKKNSSTAKPTSGNFSAGREYSHNGSSATSSSSHYDDVLQPFEPLGIDPCAPAGMDWASLAGLAPVPERPTSLATQELCVPTLPSLYEVEKLEEEVQSGFRTQPPRMDISRSRMQLNPPGVWTTQGMAANSVDPYGGRFRFPGQMGGLWFMQ